MKKNNITKMAIAAAALMTAFPAATTYAQKSTGWGDFKLFLDPGHSATENRGLWGYSEAQKVFGVAQYIEGISDGIYRYAGRKSETLPQQRGRHCRT